MRRSEGVMRRMMRIVWIVLCRGIMRGSEGRLACCGVDGREDRDERWWFESEVCFVV
jgi:hypothetical protein